jgi:CBS domain-containing protein
LIVNCPTCGEDNIPGEDLCQNCGMDLAGLDVEAWGLDPEDTVLATTLANLPLKDALVLSPSATVSEAIELMQQQHQGCVFVTDDGGALSGVLTERDVVARVAAPGRDPGRTRLEEVMTPNPVTLQKEDPLAWALHRMGVDGFRHLPILDDGQLIGFLSVRTVLEVFRGA